MLRSIRPPSRRSARAAVCLTMALFAARGSIDLAAAEPAAVAGNDAVTTPDLLVGKVVDAQGRPMANVVVTAINRNGDSFGAMPQARTNSDGRFRLEWGGAYEFGRMASLHVETDAKCCFEVNFLVTKGVTEVRVPTLVDSNVRGPADVGAGELAGIVVDEDGQPMEEVDVDVWDWAPGNRMQTNKQGLFRIPFLGRDEKVEVRFRKPGYSPETFVEQPTGVSGWIVVLGKETYVEGTVRDDEGRPAAGALVRANQGPKFATGSVYARVWSETKADDAGKYRLYLQPDEYELRVRTPDQGVVRITKQIISRGAHRLDVKLEPGVAFRATVVDAQSGEPVPNLRLWCWDQPDVEGRSDNNGLMLIHAMLPGRFEFNVEADGYTRWWSEDALSEWNRRSIDKAELGWQRNLDNLDFDLRPGMAPVKIVAEKGVRIRGRIVDPDGKPVAGATAAPALTGTGNSLTGDTRFSVTTKDDGTFDMLLPASNDAKYNLVAHDGKWQQWRTWANGVLPPIGTTPGQEINGVELKLTRPATVHGRVVDRSGKPVAFSEVRAHAADKLENRYYDPTTRTRKDGTFELKFIRPADQYIQAEPHFLVAEDAPKQTTKRLQLNAGQVVEGVELISVQPGLGLQINADETVEEAEAKAAEAGK